MAKMTAAQIRHLEAQGGRRWTKGDHDRIYVEGTALYALMDGEITFHGSGNVSHAYIGGTKKIANAKAARKAFIDVKTGRWHVLDAHPSVEADYLDALTLFAQF